MDKLSAADREAALREIVAVHRTALMSHVLRLTGGDRSRAEDILQETFLKAWQHAERLTESQGSVRGWLRRVAHNLVVDGYRAAGCRPAETELDDVVLDTVADRGPGPVQPSPEALVLDALVLRDALDRLPPEHRATLEQLFWHDRTAAQAAAVLGIPVGTVKSRTFYGLRRLRDTPEIAGLAEEGGAWRSRGAGSRAAESRAA